MRDTYDPLVYENTGENWVKIIGMLLVFYVWNMLHWWANFSLGIKASTYSTYYNLLAFGTAIIVIANMLFFGSKVNLLKVEHEFYMEKISEWKQKKSEEQAREAAKAARGTQN
tara:strand:- start:45 stop:383 length:339 start_codon:yes stop_codon:yes gene_type:complete